MIEAGSCDPAIFTEVAKTLTLGHEKFTAIQE